MRVVFEARKVRRRKGIRPKVTTAEKNKIEIGDFILFITQKFAGFLFSVGKCVDQVGKSYWYKEVY